MPGLPQTLEKNELVVLDLVLYSENTAATSQELSMWERPRKDTLVYQAVLEAQAAAITAIGAW